MGENKFQLPSSPPPPLFAGKKERNFQKQVTDELVEAVIGQALLYYPIDRLRTNFHELYGEAIEKTFKAPIHVYAIVEIATEEQLYETAIGADQNRILNIFFHKRRLNSDQNVEVQIGDYILYGTNYYEIAKVSTEKRLFGQVGAEYEAMATCIKSREGNFDAK